MFEEIRIVWSLRDDKKINSQNIRGVFPPPIRDRSSSRPSQVQSMPMTRWVLPFGLGLICGLLFSRPTPPLLLTATPPVINKSTFKLGKAVKYESQDERYPADNKVNGGNSQEAVEEEEEESADEEDVVVGETALNFKTTTTADPYLEPVDCLALLNSYRSQEIAQLKDHTADLPYHKSYVRLTKTDTPFYVSTSDGKVDKFRVGIFQNGDYYESDMSKAMQTILKGAVSDRMDNTNQKRRPIMLDVGGNVGWFSMLSAAHGAEVFVFEPNVVNMIRLCESSVLNGWSSSSNPANNQVHPYLKGVNDVHGEELVMYKVDPSNPGSFSFSKETAEHYESKFGKAGTIEEKLQLVTLDALAQDQHWLDENNDTTIAILKIDVEGLELKVLTGAQELLNSHKVQYIFLEWKITEVHRWEGMATILLNAGYVLYKIGGHQGPKDVVNTQYANGTELVKGVESIAKKRKLENTNVLFRLADI